MTSLYSAEHRHLQQEFDTTRLADLLDHGIVHDNIAADDAAFIGSCDMFFLSSVDSTGMPTVSYKGGAEGFVRVLDEHTLAFPGYDGNGMFYSVGNIDGQGKVGLLFIDFTTPHRLRVQGHAKLVRDHPLLPTWPEAKYLIVVTVTKIWVNCPRYIHRYEKVAQSTYVPQAGRETPLPAWKRLDFVQDVITPEESAAAQRLGLIDMAAYEEKVQQGDA